MTTTYAPGQPNWVDLATTNPAEASSFYGQLFGWTTENLGPEAGGYSLLRLGGRQVGGVGPVMDPMSPPSWNVYLDSDNVDDTAEKVTANGGSIAMSPMDVMDAGRMAMFIDPTGAVFGVWQPGRTRGAEVMNEPGAMSWAELMTTDVGIAKNFYHNVFPVDVRDVPIANGNTYTLLETAGQSVAGAMQITPDMGAIPPHWAPYFEVEDRDGVADRAIALGATEQVRMDVDAGRLAMLIDPQGASFNIINSNPDYAP